VRWLAQGRIEFLGRVDHQVKLRGYRIELGEIEAGLRAHPAVREAAVVLRADGPAGRRLVAYVIPSEGQNAPSDELREHLRRRLPDYMVPAAFVSLDALPLTANGKLDRHALPAPAALVERAGDRAAPSSETERAVAAVWQEVLGVGEVSADDNFFDLGGHSLLLVQVHERLAKRFPEQALPILDLFEYPTVRSLSGRLSQAVGTLRPGAPETDEQAKRQEGRQRLARRREVRQVATTTEGDDA
jgi:hypothetical protein